MKIGLTNQGFLFKDLVCSALLAKLDPMSLVPCVPLNIVPETPKKKNPRHRKKGASPRSFHAAAMIAGYKMLARNLVERSVSL